MQNLEENAYYELDMIVILATLAEFAYMNDLDFNSYNSIFKEIEKRAWNSIEIVEKMANPSRFKSEK